MVAINIKEEFFGSGNISLIKVSLPKERLTLRDLIFAKVLAKVNTINKDLKAGKVSSNFVSQAEKIVNQHVLKLKADKMLKKVEAMKVDPEKAAYEALAAFQENAFFVIVDGEQKTELEEELLLSDQSEVQFIRLMPLVGG